MVILSMSSYRLNRKVFRARAAHEDSGSAAYYRSVSWQERLRIAAYLNSVAFNYPEDSPPPMDKTKFKATSRPK